MSENNITVGMVKNMLSVDAQNVPVSVHKVIRYMDFYMDLTHNVAVMSHCKRLQVGALAVRDGRIISMGWNGQPAGMDNCCEDENNVTLSTVIHAEDNLLRKLEREVLGASRSTVFITHAPCLNCARMLHAHKVDSVVYAEVYRSAEGLKFLEDNGIPVRKH